MQRFMIIWMTLALAVGNALAMDPEAEEHPAAVTDIGIPSTPWGGQAYAQGAVSVLVFKEEGRGTFTARHLIELKRAFGFALDYVHCERNGAGAARPRRLLSARQWDVILFWTGRCYNSLPDEIKYLVLTQASEGAGLLFLDQAPGEICRAERKVSSELEGLAGGLGLKGRSARTDGLQKRLKLREPWDKLTEAQLRAAMYDTYQLGKGQAVCIKGFMLGRRAPALGYSYTNQTDHEYMYAELGRAIWCAAGKAPQVRFKETPPALHQAAGTLVAGPVRWAFDVNGEARALKVTWRLRDLAGNLFAHGEKALTPDAAAPMCEADLPQLGAGRYMLDVFVDSDKGRETFGYAGIVVAPLYDVKLEPKSAGVEPGTPIEGTLTLATCEGVTEAPAVEAVLLDLIDKEDRIIARQSVKAELDKPVTFSFPTLPTDLIPMRVQAHVLCNGLQAGQALMQVRVLQRNQDRYNVVMWGGASGMFQHWYYRQFYRTGITSSMSRGSAVSIANLTNTPFVANWNAWKGEVDGKKFSFHGHHCFPAKKDPKTKVVTTYPCCFNDKERFEKVLDFQDCLWKEGQSVPVYVYNMYDEGQTTLGCLDPHCLAAYRTWLKEVYHGDIKALNAEWGSTYTKWDEVDVYKKNDNDEKQARKEGLFARWSDRKHFMNVNFCRALLAGQARHAKQYDKHARVGFEGSGRFGLDLDALMEYAGFWSPYDGLTTEMVRSVKPKGFIHSFWIGYQKDRLSLISRGWRQAINGAPALFWWRIDGRGRFHGWLGPDAQPYPENRAFLDEVVLPLRRGLGDLLMRLEPQHDGIAIYYSVAGTHAGEIGDGAAYNSVPGSHGAFAQVIQDSGLQWIYTTKKRLLAGDLAKQGIKLLVLAYHQALGQDEVDAITTFVKNGGVVVADLRPGVYSGHCKPLAHGPADALFGIERTGPGEATRIEGKADVSFRGQTVPVIIANNRADSQIKAATAKVGAVFDGVPVFLVNALGKGHAVLLNFHLARYTAQREVKQEMPFRRFFEALTTAAGIQPRLACNDDKGNPLRWTEAVAWSQGQVHLYALYRGGGQSGPVAVKFPETQHLFHFRKGAQGKSDAMLLDNLQTGHADFFAAYPYDPGAPQVKASKRQVDRAEVITFSIRMSGVPRREQGTFSFETRLLDPSGKWVDVIPWSVQGQGGRAEVPVRFAWNDKRGTWTLEVREITTNRIGKATVELVERK